MEKRLFGFADAETMSRLHEKDVEIILVTYLIMLDSTRSVYHQHVHEVVSRVDAWWRRETKEGRKLPHLATGAGCTT
jgi:hypothetical protein